MSTFMREYAEKTRSLIYFFWVYIMTKRVNSLIYILDLKWIAMNWICNGTVMTGMEYGDDWDGVTEYLLSFQPLWQKSEIKAD